MKHCHHIHFTGRCLARHTMLLLAVGGWLAGHRPAMADTLSDGRWRYTLQTPADGWTAAEFDDRQWQQGYGGFGEPSTPGARVATRWTSNDIWLRRRIELSEVPRNPALLIHHDEGADVFLNGNRVATFEGYTTDYKVVPLSEAARASLRAGENLLAVHCHQTQGGQFIDVHVVDANQVPELPAPKRPTEPFKSDMLTTWGENVTAQNVWQEYPRPSLARDDWKNLNGLWDYAVTELDAEKPTQWDGKILVPFCLESKLSGVQKLLAPEQALWYHRTIELQPTPGRRVMLNFEAVDYRCRVWWNGVDVGQHVGGNVPFSLDVTSAVRDGKNELVVRVRDATGGAQLRGKQRLDPRGIWYTRVSGIWQTVWLEEVPARHIEKLKITSDVGAGSITLRPVLGGKSGGDEQLRVVILDGERIISTTRGRSDELTIGITNAKLWSPREPHLYDLKVTLLGPDGATLDEVESYTGLREVGRQRDPDGHLRFTLNGKVVFHWGTLDQGWWPDGLLTPPSDEAMRYDIELLKAAGFNMIRKHIKVEPRRYYYHCDRMGMMVWQDHVSGGENAAWTRLKANPRDANWEDRDHQQFMREFEAMVDALEHHPSIVVWVPFNEAWGQHRTRDVGGWIVGRDPRRLVNIASGGNFWPVGHIVDAHSYPQPEFPFEPHRYDRNYVKVMGEFGGHGWPVPGHLYDNARRNWGYGGLPKTIEAYKERYRESLDLLVELKSQGIAAGVYTQTTDVEGEINGLLTYDRKVAKIPAAELNAMHQRLFPPADAGEDTPPSNRP